MKRPGRIIIIFLIILLAEHSGFAQSGIRKIDTLKLKSQNSQSSGESTESFAKGNEQQQAANGNAYGKIKRIRSGRPDMSRARGARPPSIVRPSGSGIPKGVGKPGGAGRKGGR